MEKTCERMKEALNYFGIKPIELAERSGLSRGTISNYLSGRFAPKQDNIYKIAKALGVSEAWIMGCDVPMVKTSTVGDLFEQLDEADKMKVIGYMQALISAEKYQKKKDAI